MKRRRWLAAGGALFAVSQLAVFAWGAEVHRVVQKGRAFQAKQIAILRGDTVEFTNDDEFIHQVYVKSPSFSFSSEERQPGQNLDVSFPVAGTFEVRCEIHPKMRLTVTVR